MKTGHIFFVTGTDTSVGKSIVTASLVRALRQRGMNAGALKPIETGVPIAADPDDESDGALHCWAAGGEIPLRRITPWRLREPLAPSVASRIEGRVLDLASVERHIEAERNTFDLLLVEGAGGLLVPLDSSSTFADLARNIRARAIVVVANKLGALNHLTLTLEALVSRGIPLEGVVVNEIKETGEDLARETNFEEFDRLARGADARVLSRIPFLRAQSARQRVDLVVERGLVAGAAEQLLRRVEVESRR